jgi:hypothetical protein
MEDKIKNKFNEIYNRLNKIEKEREIIITEIIPKLKLIRKIINEYHSQIKLIEIGRQNVLDDINNEVELDKLIAKLEEKFGKC